MANHPSALKRHRQNLKIRARNRDQRSTIRSAVKSTLQAIADGNIEAAREGAKLSTRLYDKAAIHGLVHKKNAQRHISRLNKAVNAAEAAK